MLSYWVKNDSRLCLPTALSVVILPLPLFSTLSPSLCFPPFPAMRLLVLLVCVCAVAVGADVPLSAPTRVSVENLEATVAVGTTTPKLQVTHTD